MRNINGQFFRSKEGSYIFIKEYRDQVIYGAVFYNGSWDKEIRWNIDGVCLNGNFHCYDPIFKEAFPRNLEVYSNMELFKKNPFDS